MFANRNPFDLNAMFQPRSIALIGASSNLTKLSGRPLRFLKEYGYAGKIYPINPNNEEIAGLKCYPNVTAVPDEIDLAMVALPAAAASEAIRECAAKGVKAAIVFSAGFSEMGPEGARLQEELRRAAFEGGIPVNGPNCVGLVGVRSKAVATFSGTMERGSLLEGPVSFVAQSGALSAYMLAAAQDAGVGFDYWVSTGNEAVLGFADYVSYFVKQESTRTIIAYMEDARDGEAFKDCALEALEAGKPLIILKVGTSEAGSKAATSHTGALAGSDRVYDAVFEQLGVIRVPDVEDLYDLANICSARHWPKGPATAMMTISGGAGILMCDRCEEVGLQVAELTPETVEALRQILPRFASAVNPVDLTAELIATPDLLRRSMEVVLADPKVDSLAIFLGMQWHTGTKLAGDIAAMAATTEKTVLVNWIAPPVEALPILRANNIPVFSDPGRGIRALGALVRYVQRRERYRARKTGGKKIEREAAPEQQRLEKAKQVIQQARQQGRKALTEEQAKAILELYGIPVPKRQRAHHAAEAARVAQEIGFPVVMKIASAEITHKTEAGGVRLGIQDTGEASRAYQEILANAKAYNAAATLEGVLVEEMIQDGVQIIVGFKQDSRFGPMVTFGLGGIFVELIRDISLRMAPLDEEEALTMIRETKAYPLLAGFRGEPPRDIAALSQVLLAVSQLAQDFREELSELDVNPLMVLPQGCGVRAVDALMVLK